MPIRTAKTEIRAERGIVMSIRDLLPWQRLSNEGDSQTTPPPLTSVFRQVAHTGSRDVGSSTQRLAPPRSPLALDVLQAHSPMMMMIIRPDPHPGRSRAG